MLVGYPSEDEMVKWVTSPVPIQEGCPRPCQIAQCQANAVSLQALADLLSKLQNYSELEKVTCPLK